MLLEDGTTGPTTGAAFTEVMDSTLPHSILVRMLYCSLNICLGASSEKRLSKSVHNYYQAKQE